MEGEVGGKTRKTHRNMVKIQKLYSGQLVITIPKRLAEYEGLEKGMDMDFKKYKGGFILEIKK